MEIFDFLKLGGGPPVPGAWLGKQPQQSPKRLVFGVPLDSSQTELPEVLQLIGRYFKEKDLFKLEGIFRVTGNLTEIKNLQEQFDKGLTPDLNNVKDPHVIAGLLKLYFRELPNPLLTYELYDCFLAAASINDQEATLKTITSVLGMLPKVNVLIIKFLTDILREIARYSDINKMTPMNLAIVFAPSLLRPPPEPAPTEGGEYDEASIISQMKDSPYANRVMEVFITHGDEIFTPEWEAALEESIAKNAKVTKYETTSSGRHVPVPPERGSRRKLKTDSSFAMHLLRNCPRLSFKAAGREDLLCEDGGVLKVNYQHDSNSHVSKKELFEPEWHNEHVALISCKDRKYVVADAGTNGVLLSEKPIDKEHLFAVEILMNDWVAFRSVSTQKHIGLGEDKKVELVDNRKLMFQLCLKVGIMTSYKKYLKATGIWRSPWPGGDSLTLQEMFLIQLENDKRCCSICHYEPMRGGRRFLSMDGDGWKLSAKEVTEKEHWILGVVEVPPFDEKNEKGNEKEKEKNEGSEKGNEGQEKEQDKEKEQTGERPKRVNFLIQCATTQLFMRAEKAKVLAAPKDFVVDEAAIFQMRHFGM